MSKLAVILDEVLLLLNYQANRLLRVWHLVSKEGRISEEGREVALRWYDQHQSRLVRWIVILHGFEEPEHITLL